MSFSEALYARETFSKSLTPPARRSDSKSVLAKAGLWVRILSSARSKMRFYERKEDSRSNQLRTLDVATTVYPLTNF